MTTKLGDVFIFIKGIVEKYGLNPQQSGFFTGYDININAGIANSVGSAALNFVASMVPNAMDFYSKGRRVNSKPITDTFYAPFDLYDRNKFDQILEGMIHSHAQNEDPSIVEAMTNQMFSDDRNGNYIESWKDI